MAKTEETKKAAKGGGKKTEQKRTVDDLFAELESITSQLETEDLSLEEAFLRYRKGMELLKECNDAIDTVEKELQILEEA